VCVCVCVCVSPLSLLCNSSVKVSLSLLGNGSVKTLIVARQRLGRNVTAVTNTLAIIEELFDASFSMWPVSYQGKYAISSSQNLLFILMRIFFVHGLLFYYHNKNRPFHIDGQLQLPFLAFLPINCVLVFERGQIHYP
jgi:hypothetical protein